MRLKNLVRLAARKSDLARLQAYLVGEALLKKNPNLQIEYRFRESMGDRNLTDPLWKAPEKGVFTEDFYQDLVENRCDLVVHSWKDLPIVNKEQTEVVATLSRADSRDLLLLKKRHHQRIRESKRLTILSSSPRRAFNLENFASLFFPYRVEKTDFVSVRGNMQTRLRKLLEQDDADALIVAKAAFDRLLAADQLPEPFRQEFRDSILFFRESLDLLDWMVLPLSINPTAAAQGALALEIRRNDLELRTALERIQDLSTFKNICLERETLAGYGGGCHQAIGTTVVSHPWGRVQFLRGKSETHGYLNKKNLITSHSPVEWQTFSEGIEVAKTNWIHWQRVADPSGPQNLGDQKNALSSLGVTSGYIVAKAEAWVENLSGLVWTAGLSTWKKLAKRGVWVNGSFDGLGEEKSLELDQIAPYTDWIKLTHHEGVQGPWPVLSTYSLKATWNPSCDKNDIFKYNNFYWSSWSLFKLFSRRWPDLLSQERIHCCGPGHTSHQISEELVKRGLDPQKHLFVFLSAEDWRAKCQQIKKCR